MTTEELISMFETNNSDYHKFNRIPPRRRLSTRSDSHLFRLMDGLTPNKNTYLTLAASDNGITFSVSAEDLSKAASRQQVLDIIRCGLRWDASDESFKLFA